MRNKTHHTHRPAVLFISLAANRGGPIRSLITLCSNMTDAAFDRIGYAPEGRFTASAVQEGILDRLVRLPKYGHFPRLSRLVAAFKLLAWCSLRWRRVRAIHANGTSEANIAGLTSVLLRKRMIVVSRGSTVNPSARMLLPLWLFANKSNTVVVSSPYAGDVLRRSARVPSDRVTTIPNAIDPEDVVAPKPVSTETVTVGYLGGRRRVKGYQILPEVMELTQEARLRWLIALERPGLGDQDPVSEWLLRHDSAIEFVGRPRDVRGVYARCSIVFCPSLDESFGRVAVEAMANGLPVVASDIPAYRWLLTTEEPAGILFPVGDAASAAKALLRLARDAGLHNTLRINGLRRAQAFHPDKVVARFQQLYDR